MSKHLWTITCVTSIILIEFYCVPTCRQTFLPLLEASQVIGPASCNRRAFIFHKGVGEVWKQSGTSLYHNNRMDWPVPRFKNTKTVMVHYPVDIMHCWNEFQAIMPSLTEDMGLLHLLFSVYCWLSLKHLNYLHTAVWPTIFLYLPNRKRLDHLYSTYTAIWPKVFVCVKIDL